MSSRGIAPVVGVALLVLVAVAMAGVTMAVVPGGTGPTPATVAVSLEVVEGDGWELRLRHEGGDAIDLEAVSVVVLVDGEPLAHQPRVPYFSHRGFRSGGTGPFSTSTDDTWSPGEAGTIKVAYANTPRIEADSRVTVRIRRDGRVLAETSAIASG